MSTSKNIRCMIVINTSTFRLVKDNGRDIMRYVYRACHHGTKHQSHKVYFWPKNIHVVSWIWSKSVRIPNGVRWELLPENENVKNIQSTGNETSKSQGIQCVCTCRSTQWLLAQLNRCDLWKLHLDLGEKHKDRCAKGTRIFSCAFPLDHNDDGRSYKFEFICHTSVSKWVHSEKHLKTQTQNSSKKGLLKKLKNQMKVYKY